MLASREGAEARVHPGDQFLGDVGGVAAGGGGVEVLRAAEAGEGVGQDEDLKGSDKKALAVAILNALIDIPFLPESVEGMLIGWAIDAVVSALNKLVGKNWLTQLA